MEELKRRIEKEREKIVSNLNSLIKRLEKAKTEIIQCEKLKARCQDSFEWFTKTSDSLEEIKEKEEKKNYLEYQKEHGKEEADERKEDGDFYPEEDPEIEETLANLSGLEIPVNLEEVMGSLDSTIEEIEDIRRNYFTP